MNVNEPETRGVALALHVVLDDLGKGMGPALVAVLITALGRQLAFSLSIAGWIPCGMLIRESLALLCESKAADRKKASGRVVLSLSTRGYMHRGHAHL